VNWSQYTRVVLIVNNIIAALTCSPCNPVIAKNKLPNTESEIVNSEFVYSTYWIHIKIHIKNIDTNYPPNVVPFSPFRNAWWAHVIRNPADNNKTLFNNGKLK
jgi:hypothetical protein